METKEKREVLKLESLKIAKELENIDVNIKIDEDKYLSALFARADKIFKWITAD